MKAGINKNVLGLTFGVLLGAAHLVWVILVVAGVAQAVMTWILMLHSIDLVYAVNPINWGYAVLLVVITFVIGYIMGWVLAALINALNK